jgi:hypothetical protein
MKSNTPTRRIHLNAIRIDYLERVQDLAEKLRPAFEAGDLRGEREEDWDSLDQLESKVAAAAFERTPGGKLGPICRRAMVKGWEDAYLVLACSPSEKKIDGSIELAEAFYAAEECVRRDVLRIARSRGWYAPAVGESPSDEDLPTLDQLAACA